MRKKFVERTVSIYVPVKMLNVLVKDGRTELYCGTVRAMCGQFGLRCSGRGQWAEVCGPADRVQRCLEKLHYGGVPYTIGSHSRRSVV